MEAYRIYQIAEDIPNPAPDRRSKDWNKRPVIPAGSRFTVCDTSIRMTGHTYAWEGRRSDLATAIMAAAVLVEPETVRELSVVHNCDYGGDEILRILLKLGRVNAADFAAVAEVPEDF
jgi:hypothetical protein